MSRRFKLLCVLVMAFVILSVVFWLGRFTANFDNNQCYGSVISKIIKEIDDANTTKNWTKMQQLNTQLKALPLYGYETDCNEVENAIRRWNK